MTIQNVWGLPGFQTGSTVTPRNVFKGVGDRVFMPGGKIINGAKSGDSNNSTDPRHLQPGLLMGKITSSGYYAPSILGTITAAYTSGGTTLNVSAAAATEIVRRVGSSGSLKAVGPPSAAGTVATTSVTFSAVNTSTGDITVTSLGVNKIAGTWLTDTDGSEVPVTLIPDGFPIRVIDASGSSVNTPFPLVPLCGVIYTTNIINWPSDTSLRAWVETCMNAHGQFIFDYNY